MMEIKQKIKSAISRVLDITQVPDDISQMNCEKWDSLGHLNLIIEIESDFDISIEPEEIAEMKTLLDIERIVNCKIN